ncbi:TonB-dependent receptor [Sphingopyxis alaskensis]|jgi:outer membrane receptor protein involved in Fe transport|uniref:TonB-dependent receptor n=1 Tax=Sphingopyxis alaskensis TaxID=117207 RepID=UPI002040EAEF|nr:TonB-dependent receptor [Sphingopyxis alaskensis]MCM3420951.1 TonB-dependent receptor [Sphingopyxis alaskensis]
MRNGKFGRSALMVAAAMGGLCLPAVSTAQETRQAYNIEAVSLSEALTAVSRQSGVEVIFASDAVAGKRVRPLSGSYSAREAIERLIAGTDLVAEYRDGGFVIRGRAQASGEVAESPGDNVEIVVTGSHIRGSEGASPVTVRTRRTMEVEGLTDLGAFARSLPQNFSGGQNPGVLAGQGGSQNLSGSSNLNLRGLGQDATLTLINGHRVAYDAISQGVDISAIPLSAIERVEVVTDGSSAIYGSDAVGGVANIILRRDFSGLEATARFGASTDGGNAQQEYSLVGGDRWNGGGFMLAGDFSRSTSVTARQRSYTDSIHDSNTLLPAQKQYAIVVAGHQDLSDLISFSLDGQYSHREQRSAVAFSTTASATTFGNLSHPTVESFTVSPRMTFHLPGKWEAAVTGIYGQSNAFLSPIRTVAGQITQSRIHYDNEVYGIEFNADGPIVQAPGGDLRLAVGAGYRSTELKSLVSSTRGMTTTTTEKFGDRRATYFAFAEASLPLVGPDNRGWLIDRAAVNAAIRYENYPGVGEIVTPKLGAVIGITPAVTASASWGRSFKAPTLYQENQLQQGYLFPSQIFINSPLPSSASVLLLSGGNPNLRPERAETWTATVRFEPKSVPGFALQGSYFNVDYQDRVTFPIASITAALSNPIYAQFVTYTPSASFINGLIASLPTGLSNQTGAPFDPARVGALITNALTNTSHETVKGVDLSAAYSREFDAGQRLNLALAASYQESDRQISSGQPTLQLAGTIFDPPHWRGRFTGSWEQDNVALTTVVSYIGGTQDDRFQPFTRVDSFTSIDLIARVRTQGTGLFGGVEASLSVLNLLNEKPDIIRNTNPADPPYDSTNYSAAGRFVGIQLRKSW